METNLVLIPVFVATLGMAVVVYLMWFIRKEETGTPRMREIASYIQEGASAFLKRELKTIFNFVMISVSYTHLTLPTKA